jgi:serine/threonine-protein kinase
VTLTVSSGPGQAAVPAVQGRTQPQASEALRRAGFRVAADHVYDDDVPSGRVISSAPGQGTLAERRSTVTLTVSRGPRPVTVPDVEGLDRAAAQDELTARGLQVGLTHRETAAADPGTVLEQSPAGGTSTAPGSTVRLVVAKAVPQAEVPDVTTEALTADAARARLRAAGFAVRERRRTVATAPEDGLVLAQTPGPGEDADRGSTVTIVVGRFEPPAPDTTPTPTPTPTVTPTATPVP